MGYPASAYRGGARAAAGLSNAARAAPGAASMMNARTGLAPFVPSASPATALGILARAFPWLLLGLTAYQLYKLWNAKGSFGMVCGAPVGSLGGGVLTCNATVSNASANQAPNWTSPTLSLHWSMPSTNPGFRIITGSYSQPNPFLGTAPRPKLANVSIPFGTETGFSPEPWFDPWKTPINRPMPDFPALPWEVTPHVPERRAPGDPIAPGKSPRPLPRPRPRPGTLPRPLPEPEPLPPVDPLPRPGDPVPQPDPSTDPGPQPDPQGPDFPKPDPGTRPRIRLPKEDEFKPALKRKLGPQLLRIDLRPAQLKPPGASVREVKLRSYAAAKVFALANLVTESRDFIDAIWDALPKKYKTKHKWRSGPGKHAQRSGPTVQQMLSDLYKAIPELSKVGDKASQDFWNKALDNLIANQFKDYVFGKFGQAQAGANRRMGRPLGVGAGPAL